MNWQIDLNCDMGESFGNYQLGNDSDLLDYVSSANIACGFHAGDPVVMQRTVALAAQKGVAIGAHPAYPDLQGFGRRKLDMTAAELEACLIYQIGALDGFVRLSGLNLTHVKAHGALYNAAAAEPAVAKAYVQAVARYNSGLAIVCLASATALIAAANQAGLRVLREAFADRAYNPDGSLVSRQQAGSLLTDPEQAAEQVIRLVKQQQIQAQDGSILHLTADTVCIHGDTPTALQIVRTLRERLHAAGISVQAP